MVEPAQLHVKALGEGRIESPLGPLVARQGTTQHYVDESDRVLFDDTLALLGDRTGEPRGAGGSRRFPAAPARPGGVARARAGGRRGGRRPGLSVVRERHRRAGRAAAPTPAEDH
jgi:hypothetical protein